MLLVAKRGEGNILKLIKLSYIFLFAIQTSRYKVMRLQGMQARDPLFIY